MFAFHLSSKSVTLKDYESTHRNIRGGLLSNRYICEWCVNEDKLATLVSET